MAKRTGGFIGQDGINAPDPATGVSASGGDTQATVSFTSPSDEGGADVTEYRVQSNDGIGASGSASPITVTGLTNGTSYTFNVWAINPFGWSSPSDASGGVSPVASIALFLGGNSTSNVIDTVSIKTLGNATDFGDLRIGQAGYSCEGNATRGLISMVREGGEWDCVDYVTFASAGNSVKFGDLSYSNMQGASFDQCCGNSTRYIGTAKYYSGAYRFENFYLTYSTTGNSSTFGDLSTDRFRGCGFSSPTRGVFAGGEGSFNQIEYVTIASTGNGTDFGDLTQVTAQSTGASSSTRGVSMGGYVEGSGPPFTNVISYVTIASTGNATDFGDLTISRTSGGGGSSETRAVNGGGENASTQNVIDYIEIASTGNAADFGDLTVGRYNVGGMSNAHGGLS